MEIETLKYEPFVIPPAAALADLHKADRELVDVNEINIPDLYHVIAWMKDSEPRAALAVNQTWMIALDLLKVLRDVDATRWVFDRNDNLPGGALSPHCTNTIPTEEVNE